MISFFKKKLGLATILFLALFPVARWAMMLPLEYRFFDLSATMTSFGQITGLAGMAMFSVSLILSARLKFLERYFSGLDKVYQKHHIFGGLSFSLLLFHPLFLVFKYIQISLRDAAMFFLPSSNTAINEGIISLLIFMILMISTFYIRQKYQLWKLFHKFTVIAFLIGIFHAVDVSSDVSRDAILRYYILGLAFLGLVAGVWRAFLYKYYNRNFNYAIKNIKQLGEGLTEIEMEPEGEAIKFEAGQFIFISFKSEKITPEVHPFSIASSPGAETLKIVIKALGDYTSEVKNLKACDKASIEGPYGGFSYKKARGKDQIWLAGGIGVTPMLSMAGDLKVCDGYKVDLYYCTKNQKEEVFIDDFLRVASENKDFKVFSWRSEEKGRISAQAIFDMSGGLKDKDIFLCGPPSLIVSLSGQFEKMGIGKDRVHWENFNFK